MGLGYIEDCVNLGLGIRSSFFSFVYFIYYFVFWFVLVVLNLYIVFLVGFF